MAWEGDLGREGWHLLGSGKSPGPRASVAPNSMACSRTVESRVASASGAARGDQVGLVGGLVLRLSKGRAVLEPRWRGRLVSRPCGASEVVRRGHVWCCWSPRRSAVGEGSQDAPPTRWQLSSSLVRYQDCQWGVGAGVCFVRPLDKINTVCSLEHVRLREEERMGQSPGQAPCC